MVRIAALQRLQRLFSDNSEDSMVRRPIAVLLVVAAVCLAIGLAASAATTPDAALDLGLRAFRAGDYASAIVDLETAALAGSPAELHATALVYLTLAQFRSGREEEARDTIRRLLDAERLTPAYATLPLQGDAAEFETLVAALAPDATLPRNTQPADGDAAQPLPAVTRVEEPPMQTITVPTIQQQNEQTEQRIAQAQAEIEEAERRAAAAEQRAAQEVVARVAAEREAAVAREAATETRTSVRTIEAPDASAIRASLNDLRQAEALADMGETDTARRIYLRLAASPAREILAAAAVGLYRIAAYRDAIDAFRRLGALARGEEDLHYYYAVALYEAGEFEAARKELACALPFIEVTDEVARYRLKIERSQS
jgi:tetratricopeptide (TPR) repeat protein